MRTPQTHPNRNPTPPAHPIPNRHSWYNWFNGNQTALWTATNSSGPSSNSFCINVHGTANVLVGDVTIAAYTPVEEEWFCDGYSAFLGGA